MKERFINQNLATEMIKLFRKSNVSSLQRKYDKLMHEAYVLSKANPTESMERQKQALEVQRQILDRGIR